MPLVLAAYWLLPRRWRNGLLAASSLLFYAWGAGRFVLFLIGCIALNFALGVAIDSDRLRGRNRARAGLLLVAIIADLGLLAVWKYADFVSRQVHTFDHAVPILTFVLPIGISFFTFHHLSYVVDVYRRNRPAQRSPVAFTTYVAMFPQLIAGPIVRYHEISDQLPDVIRPRISDFTEGFPRFALGLAKKVVVADTVARIANPAFGAGLSALDTRTAWLGALAYTIQIYFDFSGYSDMAIGLGRMFGFRLPENFNRPYSAVSITDFWRRWHMSLSRWFRDYLYIPLGGNRRGGARTYLNLYIVFALTGFWHGANWTFLIWGLYHGTWLVIERATGLARIDAGHWQPLRRAATLLIVIVGWVLFRATSLTQAVGMLRLMFVPRLAATSHVLDGILDHRTTLVFLLFLGVVLMPRSFVMGRFLEPAGGNRTSRLARLAYSGVAAPYAALLAAAGTFSPFLYFRF
ncbi:MAG TPA: MBOAT family protein [Mycobacteriales bacterium]|nr:MBOAT family protein [Mycobacteriales bacterium]